MSPSPHDAADLRVGDEPDAGPSPPVRRRPSLSLKLRLLAIVAGVLLLGVGAAVAVILQGARQATVEEIDANLLFSRHLLGFFVADTRHLLSREDVERLSQVFQDLRHVRVSVASAPGEWVMLNQPSGDTAPPAWFEHLIVPADSEFPDIEFHGWGNASIRIQATPDDEVAEVWGEVTDLLPLMLGLLVAICLLVYAGFWFGLAPLRGLHEAFRRLEADDFTVRLPTDAVPELADTQRRFNHLVDVLARHNAERAALMRRLVTMQEDERRSIARELHDEMGPHLFGLRSRLSTLAWSAEAGDTATMSERVRAMQHGLEHLQQQVRRLLKQLRPPVLDDLGLAQALDGMVADWQRRHPEVDWVLARCDLTEMPDDAVQVTAYRAVQECLTNVARHAAATRAAVRLWTEGGARLRLDVTDDGAGRPDQLVPGMGLSGLRERVVALNGAMALEVGDEGEGLRVTVTLPLTAFAAPG